MRDFVWRPTLELRFFSRRDLLRGLLLWQAIFWPLRHSRNFVRSHRPWAKALDRIANAGKWLSNSTVPSVPNFLPLPPAFRSKDPFVRLIFYLKKQSAVPFYFHLPTVSLSFALGTGFRFVSPGPTPFRVGRQSMALYRTRASTGCCGHPHP